MSRIDSIGVTDTTTQWMQINQEVVTTHSAWHADLPRNEAEKALEGHPPGTYLLRLEEKGERDALRQADKDLLTNLVKLGDKEALCFVSFVEEDGSSIKHQYFVARHDTKGFILLNAGVKPNPVIPDDLVMSKDLVDFVSKVTHYDRMACTPLRNV